MTDKYQKFIDKFEKDLAEIKTFEIGNPEIQQLLDWMLTTEVSPYSYLSDRWAGYTYTVSGMLSIFHTIHHAYYDDGAMSFVAVNGHPKIVFAHQSDYDSFESFVAAILSPAENQYSAKVEILDIAPNEFGPLVDDNELTYLKRCYVHDVARNGVEFANKQYSEYSCFSPTWETELAEKIERRKNLMNWH